MTTAFQMLPCGAPLQQVESDLRRQIAVIAQRVGHQQAGLRAPELDSESNCIMRGQVLDNLHRRMPSRLPLTAS